MAKNHKKKANSRASRKEQKLKVQRANANDISPNKQKHKQPPKKVKAYAAEKAASKTVVDAVDKDETVELVATAEKPKKETVKKVVSTESLKSEESETAKLVTLNAKIVETRTDTVSAPGVLTGVAPGRLVGAIAACIAFALLYNVVITPYVSVAPVTTTEETTTTTTTTTETTTVTTTEITTEITTRKLAAPVTKVYKPKATAAPKVTASSKKVLLSVPMVSQLPSYPTGCEAASATMMLQYYGYNVGIGTMVSAIPRENLYEETLPDGTTRVYGPSIYQKFVGDPRQTYTSETPGYGAFAPVVTSAMNSVINRNGGKHVAKNITGSSVNTLLKYLDKGYPVIVWSTAKMKTPEFVNSWYIKTPSGDQYFEYPRGTHVTVLTGYDSSKVYMNDPYFGKLSFSHSAFAVKYALLGKQAIIIEEREETTTEEFTTVTESTTLEENITSDESATSNENTTLGEGTTTGDDTGGTSETTDSSITTIKMTTTKATAEGVTQ